MAWRTSLVNSLARVLGLRSYNAAKQSGHVWGGSRAHASANVNDDLCADLAQLRRRSRNAWQNSSTARAVVEADIALVVSTGIDVEPDTGNAETDARLRDAWSRWTEQASACGTMDLWTMQRQARRSERLAGEFLWVLVDTDEFRHRGIPRAVMPVEPDRLSGAPIEPVPAGMSFAQGIVYDRYGRPMYYDILDSAETEMAEPMGGTMVAGSGGVKVSAINVGSARRSGGKRYPATDVIHGYDPQRPGQLRGEPGLAPVLNTIRQELELVEAELTAAKVGAAHSVKIKSPSGGLPPGDPNAGTDGSTTTYDFSPGSINILGPGEDAEVMANPRPSQQVAPFRQMLRGDIAGATGVPQRYIDRDTSRANYSSMRADMLDTQRVMTPQQHRFGRQSAADVYQRILPQLATVAGVSIPSDPDELAAFCRCKIMPDGWAYVDPQKDVGASIDAIRSGFSTWEDELQSRGRDPRRVLAQLKQEIADPVLGGIFAPPKPAAPAPEPKADGADDKASDKDEDKQEHTSEEDRQRSHARALELARASAPPAPVVNVSPVVNVAPAAAPSVEVRNDIPAQPAPVVNVAAPAVTVQPAEVRVEAQPAPVVNINVPQQPAPTVTVQAAPAAVTIENTVEVPARTIKAVPQRDGSVLMTPQE